MTDSAKTLPVDPISAAKLAEDNLRMTLVDTSDAKQFEGWAQASNRGFHGTERTEEQLAGLFDGIGDRRTTGVWDDTAAVPGTAVGTVDSFESPLSVPGGGDIPAWAISMVTVAQSHRRRGIARELLESELRTAAALGIPMAMLTVSESTIYHRFGFAPATSAADLTIDTRRARYSGPVPDGRVQLVPLATVRAQVDELYRTARLASPGEMQVWPRRWDQIFGTADEKDIGKQPRAVRYDDAAGTTQGFAVYRMKELEHDFTGHTAEVEYLMANTPDAYAALWRFLLELDLTSTVHALLRSVDEPLRWLIDDFRAMTVETYDHLWLRILDVPATLQAREYYAPARLIIEVADALGHAAGTYRFDSTGSIPAIEPVEPGTPDLILSINELSAIYLGGISAVTLKKANRITERTPGAVARLEAAFHSPVAPWLSVWF